MAVPHPCLDNRDGGIFHHRLYKARPAPGNQHVNKTIGPHHLLGALPAGVRHQLNGTGGKPRLLQRFIHKGRQSPVGLNSFPAAPKDTGVAGFYTEGGGIHRHIGPRLVDNAHHPQRYPDAGDRKAVGPLASLVHLPHRVRQGDDFLHRGGDILNPLFVQG